MLEYEINQAVNIASILSRAIFITLMIHQAVHAIDARQCSDNKILHFHAVHSLSTRQCKYTKTAIFKISI